MLIRKPPLTKFSCRFESPKAFRADRYEMLANKTRPKLKLMQPAAKKVTQTSDRKRGYTATTTASAATIREPTRLEYFFR